MRPLIVSAALILFSAAPVSAQAAQRFGLGDFTRLVQLSDPQISPDGRSIAVVVTRADTSKNTWVNSLELIDVANGARRVLSRDRVNIGTPRWSPSGDRLAFTASAKGGDDGPAQVFVMPMNGGDARRITSAPMGVQQFAWRPNGRDIAFVTADQPADTNAHKTGHDAFEISSNDYLTTEAPAPAHLWITPADSDAARRLTNGAWSLPISFPPGSPSSPISWSPDGSSIAIVKQTTPYSGEGEKTTVQLLDVATGSIRPLTSHAFIEAFPEWSPDGAHIAYLYGRDGNIANVTDAYVTSPIGGAEGRNLTRGIDRMFYRVLWMPDSKSFIVGAHDVDKLSLWQVPLSGAPRKLNLGAVVPSGLFWLDASVSRDSAIVFVGAEATHPSEIYYMSSPTAAPRRLTTYNERFATYAMGKVDTLDWKGPDDFHENAIITYPPDFDGRKQYPVILYIHGGPNSASLMTFSPSSQAMAARGYIVFSPNYRGSDNLGNAFYAAVVKDAGVGPGRDVMSGLAILKKRAYVDSTRIFVSGSSYGGYMTSWLIGHYQGWRAAVAGAAVTDLADQYNLADGNIGWKNFTGDSPWTADGETLTRDQSPITSVRAIKTPTLVISTTGDVRVPVTQSYKLFRALKDLGVETKFVAYPVGGHGPGDPARIVDWYTKWMDWIESHDRPVVP